jgi:hypothetical protein
VPGTAGGGTGSCSTASSSNDISGSSAVPRNSSSRTATAASWQMQAGHSTCKAVLCLVCSYMEDLTAVDRAHFCQDSLRGLAQLLSHPDILSTIISATMSADLVAAAADRSQPGSANAKANISRLQQMLSRFSKWMYTVGMAAGGEIADSRMLLGKMEDILSLERNLPYLEDLVLLPAFNPQPLGAHLLIPLSASLLSCKDPGKVVVAVASPLCCSSDSGFALASMLSNDPCSILALDRGNCCACTVFAVTAPAVWDRIQEIRTSIADQQSNCSYCVMLMLHFSPPPGAGPITGDVYTELMSSSRQGVVLTDAMHIHGHSECKQVAACRAVSHFSPI